MDQNSSTSPEFDIILWGASGFTGSLVAEYLLSQYGVQGSLRWAIAGRNLDKLADLQARLGNHDIPIIIADSHDADSLRKMVTRTRVICTTVGPYAQYGSELVAACVEAGVDYCDLCGEVQWIRKMIDLHHEAAQRSGSRIVHCCGFDSIPSDLGVHFLQREAKTRTGEYCETIAFRVKAAKGGLSGGTFASMNNVMREARQDRSLMKLLFNPYSLNPSTEQQGQDKADLRTVKFDRASNAWIMPFIMEAINTRVVRRSHALLGFPYGKTFRYNEAMIMGKGIAGRIKGYIGLVVIGVMMLGDPDSLFKRFIQRFLPKPGEGPSKNERENGYYSILLLGNLSNGKTFNGKVKGDRDPGYGSTSKMLGESAVCLALDTEKTPSISGVLTPATAMGDTLIERLQKNAGLSFEIE